MNQIIEYYNQLAKSYDDERFNNSYGNFIDKQERKILAKLLMNNKAAVLDLACGSGRLLNYANFGLDGSAEMCRISREKHPGKEIFHSDAEKLPFADNSLDAIISFHFFMHLPKNKIENILLECHRVLNNNGRMIFDIPSKKRRRMGNYKTQQWHGASSFSISELEQLKSEHFKIKSSYGLLFFPIHRFPKKIRKYLSGFDKMMANSFLKEYSSYLVVEFEKKSLL